MMDAIDNKLNNAKAVFLLSYIWTNRIMADFFALGSLIVIQNFKTRTVCNWNENNEWRTYCRKFKSCN